MATAKSKSIAEPMTNPAAMEKEYVEEECLIENKKTKERFTLLVHQISCTTWFTYLQTRARVCCQTIFEQPFVPGTSMCTAT